MSTNTVEKLFFEKFFTEDDGFELKKWRFYQNNSLNRVQQSIIQNIDTILNNTNTLKIEEYLEKKLNFLDFGIPDFLTLYQSNNISNSKIEECIKQAIITFEPRLIDPEVKFEIKDKKALIKVKGKIKKHDNDFFEMVYYNLK